MNDNSERQTEKGVNSWGQLELSRVSRTGYFRDTYLAFRQPEVWAHRLAAMRSG